jgi:hypothetical protein
LLPGLVVDLFDLFFYILPNLAYRKSEFNYFFIPFCTLLRVIEIKKTLRVDLTRINVKSTRSHMSYVIGYYFELITKTKITIILKN